MRASDATVANAAGRIPNAARSESSWYRSSLLALFTLGCVVGSLCLAAAQFTMGSRLGAFVSQNTLPSAERSVLTAVCASSVLITWIAAGAFALVNPARVPQLERLAACLSPLAVTCALPTLFDYRLWFDRPLPHLTLLLVVVVTFERLMRWSLRSLPASVTQRAKALQAAIPIRIRRAVPLALVVSAGAAYAAYAAYYTVLEHWRFTTGGYDLGIYDSLMANLLAGRPFHSPVCTPTMSYLSNHAEFGIFYVAPLYALFPRSETLLVLQAVFLGLAAVPLYLFAATQLSRLHAAIIALCYLVYAPMHGANFYDFHWMPMAIPLWLTLLYGLATRKKWLIATVVCLVLPLREETGVMLAVLGAFLILSDYWPRLGIIFCVVGACWFGVMKFVVIPLAGTWWFDGMYASLIAPGEKGYGSVIKTMIVNPAYLWKTLVRELKLTYLLHLFAPLVFLPLRRPLLALLAFPGSFFTLLTTDYDPTLSIRFQYTSHWIPWVFAGTILAIATMPHAERRVRQHAAVAAVLLGVVCHSWVNGAVLQREVFVGGFRKVAFGISPAERQRYADFRLLAAKIPLTASVAASEHVVAHVSNRPDAYTFKIAHGDAEHLLIDSREFRGRDRATAEHAFASHRYGLLDQRGGFYLFKRNHQSPETAPALRKLRVRSART
jgi:uncharacterized membrane protein